MSAKWQLSVLSWWVLGMITLAHAAPLQLEISGQEIVDQLMHLATFSDDPNPAVTRILFTGRQLTASPPPPGHCVVPPTGLRP